MVIDENSGNLTVSEASKLRAHAGDLLDRLIADRDQSERRFAESGKRDPMKFITGRTALDSAISSTREMIQHMDMLLVTLNGELDQAEAEARPLSRQQARFHPKNGRLTSHSVAAPAAFKPPSLTGTL